MKDPYISVIISAYNEENYLPSTLQCIDDQGYKDFELIVVDNNSTDKTAAIAKSYGARVVREKKQGYVYSLNRGILETKGEIVVVIDSDTLVPSDLLQNIVEIFKSKRTVGVTGKLVFHNSSLMAQLSSMLYDIFIWVHFLIGIPHVTGTCMAFRHSTLQAIHGANNDYKIGADVDLGIRAKKYGKVIYDRNIQVITSSRRWKKRSLQQFIKYTKVYFNVVWFHKAVHENLTPIR